MNIVYLHHQLINSNIIFFSNIRKRIRECPHLPYHPTNRRRKARSNHNVGIAFSPQPRSYLSIIRNTYFSIMNKLRHLRNFTQPSGQLIPFNVDSSLVNTRYGNRYRTSQSNSSLCFPFQPLQRTLIVSQQRLKLNLAPFVMFLFIGKYVSCHVIKKEREEKR